MKIKVCGMRDADNIRAVSDLGADMIGFIFWKGSPRYVQMISSSAGTIPDYSEERLAKRQNKSVPPERPERVGVFMDDMPQNIVTRVYNYDLDYIQLHGSESRIMIENLRSTLVPDIKNNIKIIKTLSIRSKDDIEAYKEYEGIVDMFLFDTKMSLTGGSDEQFNLALLDEYKGKIPFLLGGGISLRDTERLRRISHPLFAGVNLNSKFETEPGMKDIDKLRTFIEEIRR